MAVSFTEYMVALRGSDLTGSTRSIALWVASRCSDGWPVTREMIADDSGFSRATVTRAVTELCDRGWLVPTRNRRQGNSYELAIPRFLSAHSEHTEGSQRAYKNAQGEHINEPLSAHGEPNTAHGEHLKESISAHSEHTEGSQRADKYAHGEHTYTRTEQKQQKHPRVCARRPAREEDAATIKHSDLNQTQLWRWVKKLEKDPDAKAEIFKFRYYRTPSGEVYTDAFVTALLSSERLFESFRPWFVRLQSEGRL